MKKPKLLILLCLVIAACLVGCGQADHAPAVPYAAVPDMGVEIPSVGDEAVGVAKQALSCPQSGGGFPADLYSNQWHTLGIVGVFSADGCPTSQFTGEPLRWLVGINDTVPPTGAPPKRTPQPALACEWLDAGTFDPGNCAWRQKYRCNYGDRQHQITYTTMVTANGTPSNYNFWGADIWMSATGNALLNAQGQACTRIITGPFHLSN